MRASIRVFITILVSLWGVTWPDSRLIAQESAHPAVLESRVSPAAPVEGDIFHYFLKFDYAEDAPVYPAHHFEAHGITVVETRSLEPQTFAGRVIQQYEYTLLAPAGEYAFSPVTLQYPGPVANPAAVRAEPLQVTVVPVVEVRVESNSPIMLGEPVTVTVVLTKRKPVTVTAFPHELQADFRMMPAPFEPEAETSATPTPPPPALRFELGDASAIASQEVAGQTRESYVFETRVAPQQPGMYVIPMVSVGYATAAGEARQALTPDETPIFVLHPHTANVMVPTDYGFLTMPAIVAGALILAGIAALWAWQRRKKRPAAVVNAPPLPPAVVARNELAAIQAMGLPARGEFKRYYTLVSEAARKFLGAEFGFQALERTTAEVMRALRQQALPPTIVADADHILREADLVKFAKYIPLPKEADAVMQHAVKLVDDSVAHHQRRNAAE